MADEVQGALSSCVYPLAYPISWFCYWYVISLTAAASIEDVKGGLIAQKGSSWQPCPEED